MARGRNLPDIYFCPTTLLGRLWITYFQYYPSLLALYSINRRLFKSIHKTVSVSSNFFWSRSVLRHLFVLSASKSSLLFSSDLFLCRRESFSDFNRFKSLLSISAALKILNLRCGLTRSDLLRIPANSLSAIGFSFSTMLFYWFLISFYLYNRKSLSGFLFFLDFMDPKQLNFADAMDGEWISNSLFGLICIVLGIFSHWSMIGS